MDVNTEENFILEGTSLMIAGTNINFTTERLKKGHRYNVLVRASNAAGFHSSHIFLSKECVN